MNGFGHLWAKNPGDANKLTLLVFLFRTVLLISKTVCEYPTLTLEIDLT